MSTGPGHSTIDASTAVDTGRIAHSNRHDVKRPSFHSHRTSLGSRSPIGRRGDLGEYSEQDPFLPPRSSSTSPSTTSDLPPHRPSRRALKSIWILPVVLAAGLSRGMTMAPRIEVYTQIACDVLCPGDSIPRPLNVTMSLPLPLSVPRSSAFDQEPLTLELHFPKFRKQNPVRAAKLPEKCLHDPAVQSRAAKIQATIGTIVGILSIVTAGYWGQVSDAFGRKKTLSAVLLGMSFHDLIYIMVSISNTIFHKNAWGFLVIGAIVEGLVGGLTMYYAVQNAYLADCAPEGSRATVFAYYQGISYIALALGPQLGGIVIQTTASEAGLPAFYLGLFLHLIGLLYAVLVLPETVTPEMMHAARHSTERQVPPPSEAAEVQKERWTRRMWHARHRVFSPIAMFGPHRKAGGGWDLNLMFLVIAQFTHLLSVGVVQVKYLYAQHTYAWSVKQLGYYISLLWTLRAFHLLLLLPTIVHFVKPRQSPLLGSLQILSQNLRFDYRIAQFSIFIDTAAYVLTLIAPASSEVLFVTFTSLSSFTAGVNPAIHSLAVSFLQTRDNGANIGQMFGGMSMLQALAHTLQPMIFGLTYSQTAATYPKAIFVLAAGLLIASVALLTLLRTNQTRPITENAAGDEEGDVERENSPFGIAQDNGDGNKDGATRRGRAESKKPLLLETEIRPGSGTC